MIQPDGKINRGSFQGLTVCMVAPYLPRKGGVTIQAHLLVDRLEEEGVQVLRVDTILHRLSHPIFAAVRMPLQLVTTAFKFLIAGRKSDVVHIHACSFWGFLPVLACVPFNKLFVKKRLVISFHGAMGHVWIAKYHKLFLPYLKAADYIVVVSPLLHQAFEEYGLRSEFVKNLVDLDRFKYRKRESVSPKIVWIRHFEDYCDPMTALKAFELIQAKLPQASITFIGDGSQKSQMEAFITEHKLQNVSFTGKLPNEQVPQVFDQADLFLNSSKYDGLPTCLLEASACGLPIVSTNPGGIPDMLKNGQEGVLVDVGDAEALAREVIALAENNEKVASISEAARQNAEMYGWGYCALTWRRIYTAE